MYPCADLSETERNIVSIFGSIHGKCLICVIPAGVVSFHHRSDVVYLPRWSSCISGCWRSLWSRRTSGRPGRPAGSSSAPAWWCWRSVEAVPIAPGCPARIDTGLMFEFCPLFLRKRKVLDRHWNNWNKWQNLCKGNSTEKRKEKANTVSWYYISRLV